MTDKIKVLMVDDEDQFRKTTSRILEKRGFAVSMAESGEEALDIMKSKSHDVVILDIKMKGMDGHETLSQIRRIDPDIKVIMLTGHGDEDSAKASHEMGAFDYLNKPCDIDLLAAKVHHAYSAIKHKPESGKEKSAEEIMIHIDDYTTLTEDKSVMDAIRQLMLSFEGLISTSRVMETGHRSILVFDKTGNVLTGILSIRDLIRAVRPAYLSAPKPSMADSMQYSPMFWTGLFTSQTRALASKKVGEIMSDTPPMVDSKTNLMELADLMFSQGVRRVAVIRDKKVVGVVREQELFFEMADIIL